MQMVFIFIVHHSVLKEKHSSLSPRSSGRRYNLSYYGQCGNGTLTLLQSDSQDYGTTNYALCPHDMLWHIATFNSYASWKTKGHALIHKKVRSKGAQNSRRGNIYSLVMMLMLKSALRGIMSQMSLENVRACLAKSIPARNGFPVLLHGPIAWPET